MNYNLAVSRSKVELDIAICVHGLDKNICGFCQGLGISKTRSRIESNIDPEILCRYEELKAHFKNFQEIWSEDEFFVVYANLKDVRGTKLERPAIYRAAFELSRTIGAIRWAMEHLFSERKYHRGKTVIEFRKLFGLK
jgi:hypothetical protein